MSRFDKRVGYAVAIVACTIVLLIRMALSDTLAEQARLMPFVIAVMAAAWWGGLGPGILATLLSAFLGILFIVPPANSLEIVSVADAVNAAIFVFLGFTISFAVRCVAPSQTERSREAISHARRLDRSARVDGAAGWISILVQSALVRLLGPTLEQLRGDGWQIVCDAAELPRVLRSWHAALAKGETWEETYPLRRHDGQMRWHLARAVPVRDARGDIDCWFGTSTDIQDRIEIEQTLKDADLRKNQFLATLAHELRNPLSPISNSLQLWPHVENDKAALEQVRTVIERQLQQLVRLIDDLMDLSRISSGKISLRREPIDLGHVIARAVETAQPGIDAALPPVDGHDARRADLYQRRRGAPHAGLFQHPEQCGQIHGPRRPDLAGGRAARRAGDRADSRQRPRHSACDAHRDFLGVSPGRLVAQPLARRTGHRLVAGPADRRTCTAERSWPTAKGRAREASSW